MKIRIFKAYSSSKTQILRSVDYNIMDAPDHRQVCEAPTNIRSTAGPLIPARGDQGCGWQT